MTHGESLSIRVEGIINVPLFNFITAIYEPESYASWVPFCKQGKEVINNFKKVDNHF